MTQYFFTKSIAPISHAVCLLRFPIDTVVTEFEKWSSGPDSFYIPSHFRKGREKSGCNAHVKKVSARRDQLAELIIPQNHITQFVFVPTKSDWTAIFGPCSIPMAGKLPIIDRFSQDLAFNQGIEARIPYRIYIEYSPWVDIPFDTYGVGFYHCRTYGNLLLNIFGFPSNFKKDGFSHQYDCYVGRRLYNTSSEVNGRRYRHMEFRASATEPLKDYDFDFDSLPEVTEFPPESFTDEHARIMWSQFGEKQVDEMLAPLGVSPHDDAFYGTEGYLVRLTPARVRDPYMPLLPPHWIEENWIEAKDFEPTPRIPLEKYQFFHGLKDGPIRSWSSIPISE